MRNKKAGSFWGLRGQDKSRQRGLCVSISRINGVFGLYLPFIYGFNLQKLKKMILYIRRKTFQKVSYYKPS